MKSILTTLLTLLSLGCLAQHHLAIGASTSGVGISYRHTISSTIDWGASLYYLRLNGNTQNVILENIVQSNYKVNTPLVETFVQWKPLANSSLKSQKFKNGIFVKTGLAYRLNANFNSNSTFYDKTLIGSFELSPDQVGYVTINVKTRKIQPLLAVGYPIFNSDKFFMTAEMGTYFHGTPNVNMKATGTLHLNTVNQNAIQNTISKYKYFPLLKIETGIKF